VVTQFPAKRKLLYNVSANLQGTTTALNGNRVVILSTLAQHIGTHHGYLRLFRIS